MNLLILSLLAIVLIVSLVRFNRTTFLVGDIDVDRFGANRGGAELFGNSDDDDDDLYDYDEDEDDIALSGDINGLVPAISLTGDADEEENMLLEEMDKLMQGQSKVMKSGRKVSPGDRSSYPRSRNMVKPAGPAKFKPGLVEKKMLVEAIGKNAKDPAARSTSVNTIKSLSKIVGGLTRFIELAPLMVTGGRHSLTTTNLKIDGETFVEVYKYWRVNYPGLSITKRVTSSGGTATVTFGTSASGYVSKILPLIITIAGNEFTKIKNQFVNLAITGTLSDGTAFNSSLDEIEMFTDKDLKTTKIVVIPYKVVKQRLHPMVLAPVTTSAEVSVTISGLPDDVVVTVRAASEDDAEWIDYQKMTGLK